LVDYAGWTRLSEWGDENENWYSSSKAWGCF
jgi:hypothetical protein